MKRVFLIIFQLFSLQLIAQNYNANSRFEQLGSTLPTPNATRSASGAPGAAYWQQRADYDIKAELNDQNRSITASETITYTNKAPESLGYLWLQLDQNVFAKGSTGKITTTGGIEKNATLVDINAATQLIDNERDYGFKITAVKDPKTGTPLKYTINQTMMRVELPKPLITGQSVVFQVDWHYNIVNMDEVRARAGFEYFPKDGNCAYFIAQWFPRMCVYDDVNGWQHKQFLGQGEFYLPFGDYKVAITVPNDHIVGATGELQNMSQTLTPTQLKRWEQAKAEQKTPVEIVNQAEATANEKNTPTGKKTWIFTAQNVRDFGFCSSRKFIWDALAVDVNGKKTMAMSYFPKEGNPLWGKYSTQAVAHTIRTYNKYTIDYPYPVAISANWGRGGGMEYPMICFNAGRPNEDGTYSEATKYGLISVVIHEVGHNFFPMIINSDERQWSWMDEGLNSFVQYLSEQEWQRDYPSRRGEPQKIVEYMASDAATLSPIMTSADNVINHGPNAYSKPATALNILRETVMGRELFDYAFKEYARRWAFKHPQPADFFRTMEDASGVDLDWFWKGWFYGVEPVDQDLADVQWFAIDPQDAVKNKASQKAKDEAKQQTLANIRNKTDIKETAVEQNPDLKDFYNSYDKYAINEGDTKKQEQYLASLSDDERKLMAEGMNFYTINIKNKGGLPMPVIVKMVFEDGSDEIVRIPAEIWRLNDKDIKKVIPTKKKVVRWVLDPFFEIADIDTANNSFPKEPQQPTKFQMFRANRPTPSNPMQEAQRQSPGAVQGAVKK